MSRYLKAWSAFWWRTAKQLLAQAQGANRIRRGYCPLCNSDAPETDSCIFCGNYRHNGPYPPDKETKDLWRKEWARVYRFQMIALRAVRDSRLGRLGDG